MLTAALIHFCRNTGRYTMGAIESTSENAYALRKSQLPPTTRAKLTTNSRSVGVRVSRATQEVSGLLCNATRYRGTSSTYSHLLLKTESCGKACRRLSLSLPPLKAEPCTTAPRVVRGEGLVRNLKHRAFFLKYDSLT